MHEHEWIDITTMQDAGNYRRWICPQCGKRMTTDWSGPFTELPGVDEIPTIEVDMEFPSGRAHLDRE